MNQAIRNQALIVLKSTALILLFAAPIAVQAGYGHGHGKSNKSHGHSNNYKHHANKSKGKTSKGKKTKARMSVCHYTIDGDYDLLSLPVHAAMKMLARNELDKEPVVGDDGVESCVPVSAPETTCRVNVNGTELTVAEYLATQEPIDNFNTDSNSCEINGANGYLVALFNNSDGAGLDIFFGPGNRLLIDSQQQYDDCAFDMETAAQTNETCPDVVQFNEPTGTAVSFPTATLP